MAQLKPNHPTTVERLKVVRVGFSLDWRSVIATVALAELSVATLFLVLAADKLIGLG